MVEETDDWQSQEISLGVGSVCGSDIVGGVGDVEDEDQEGGDASHSI